MTPINQRSPTATNPVLLYLLCACLALGPVTALGDIESLREQAEQGDAEASFKLAERYLHGEGVEPDDERAAYWYRKAAEGGYYRHRPAEAASAEELAPQITAVGDRPPNGGQRIVSPPLEPTADTDSRALPAAPAPIPEADAAPAEPGVTGTIPLDPGPTDRPTSPAASETNIAAAEQALDAGDYTLALQLLYAEAMQDNPAAQTQLGDLYMQGQGVDQSHERAMLWYRQAARQNDARAQFNLGNMYLLGEGVLQDDETARDWYALAAAQGHAGARNNLENLERRMATRISPLATQPPPPAIEIREEVLTAMETESEPAMEQETEPAVEAVIPPARTAEPGRVVTPPIEPIEMIQPGIEAPAETDPAESPLAEPATTVANLPDEVEATVAAPAPLQADDDDARVLYERGQQLALGEGAIRNPAAAISYYRRSAELGYAPAQYRLGAAYHYGDGVSKDLAEAATWYRHAAEQGFIMAQRNLGNLYLRGEGVAQDKVRALAWLSLVATRGSDIDRQQQEQLAGSLSEAELEQARELAAQFNKL